MEIKYWDAQGRVEGIRYMLHDSGVEFVDNKLEFTPETKESWFSSKKEYDITKSGYFGGLPLLKNGDHYLSQTTAIMNYLGEKLGYYEGMTEEEKSLNLMTSVAAYDDVLQEVLMIVYTPMTKPHVKLQDEYNRVKELAKTKLGYFERLLGEAVYFSKKEKPSVGDFMVFHVLRSISKVVGNSFVAENAPKLEEFVKVMESRERIKAYLESGKQSTRLTGYPNEAAVIIELEEIQKGASA